MTLEEAKRMQEETVQNLVDKGRLILTVDVKTKEQAEELMRWMYSPDKPMKSELIELAWDKKTVTKQEADLLGQMRDVLINQQFC